MTLDEIKAAVLAGKRVFWSNLNYEVLRHVFKNGEENWCIVCLGNGHTIGLTWLDGVTLNGKPEDFFIA